MKNYMICFWDDCQQDVDDIMEHLSSHVGYQKEFSFHGKCMWKFCKVSKSTRSRLLSHLRSHLDLRPYKCHCGKKFKRKSDLKAHNNVCKTKFEKAVQLLFHGIPIPHNFECFVWMK
eukprot:NODE_162_length_14959_cov_1.379610.p12 type:complete len:117 gc:universal NODE_162_length_14959_cov_1.379610:4008-4358(+)